MEAQPIEPLVLKCLAGIAEKLGITPEELQELCYPADTEEAA